MKKRLERSVKHENILVFIEKLSQIEVLITELDEVLSNGTIEKVRVYLEEKMAFVFKDGIE